MGIQWSDKLRASLDSYNKKLGMIEKVVTGMVRSQVNSLLITGAPGIGKSYTVNKVLKRLEDEDGINPIITKCHLTPLTMYQYLCDYRDSKDVIVFDDCDDVLYKTDALNLLKAATELGGARKVSWHSNRVDEQSIIYHGKIIVITNYWVKGNPHFIAICDRMHVFPLNVSLDEKLAKIQSLSEDLLKKYDTDIETDDIIDYIVNNKDKVNPDQLTIRSFCKLIELKVLVGSDWQDFVESMKVI
jgi:predicted ATPase